MSTGEILLPKILLTGDPPTESIHVLLESAGFPVTATRLAGIEPAEIARHQLVIFDVHSGGLSTAQALCRRWRIELGEQHIPFLWRSTDSITVPCTAGLDAGADVCVDSTITPGHFIAQVKALLRIQHVNARLLGRAGEAQNINHRLRQAYQQIESDLELTRRLHRSFMPRLMPEVLRCRFAVCYRPRSRMGGDFYDVLRLDEENVAVYVADAMGRGLPASSLLSIYVKKMLRPKEIDGKSYRIHPPHEVLSQLNRDLLGLGLAEPPFVTMLYLQIQALEGRVIFGRTAHPHPLYIPGEGAPEYWPAAGALLGIYDAEYPEVERLLVPGDKILLYTDGVHPEGLALGEGTNDPLIETVNEHRDLGVQAFVDQVARGLLERTRSAEDFTLLAVEFV